MAEVGAAMGMRGVLVRVLAGVLVIAGIVVVIAATGGDSGGHRVAMTAHRATGLIPGFDVRQAGVRVGSVESVDLTDDYKARIELRIDDEAWPLPRGTVFRERLSGTIKYSDRFVAIDRGTSPKTIRDGETLPGSSFVNPVEFDEVLNIFDARTRKDLGATLETGGAVAPGLARNLPRALVHGPAAAVSTETIMRQLGDDPRALDALVRSTADVAGAVADADPAVGELIASAGTTFAAVASRSRALEATLEQAPSTLAAARSTAGRVDTTLRAARSLTDRLSPGVDRVRAIARPLDQLLRTVVDVGPDARATLSTLGRAAPDLNGLLDRARTPLMPRVQSIGKEGAVQVGCLRPFSPEIGGLAVTWAGFWSRGDRKDKFFRAQAGSHPTMNETPMNSGQYAKLLPDNAFHYAFPRPPGENVNQPWFQPQCGITEDALNPEKDPEATAFDPMSKKLVDFGPETGGVG